MNPNPYEALKLRNQVCFPLYACTKELVRQYGPFLKECGLTYTQYIVMMVLWERQEITVKELGETLWLDSGTLTPVLKKLEAKGLVKRQRAEDDERKMTISVTDAGMALRARASCIPAWITDGVALSREDRAMLRRLIFRFLGREIPQ